MDIAINTGIEDFTTLSRVIEVGDKNISAIGKSLYAFGEDALQFQIIETAAQLCAHHVRHIVKWEKHAFLLGLQSLSFAMGRSECNGIILDATLLNHSDRAYQYKVEAESSEISMYGEILVGVIEYESHEEKERLLPYYRELWECFITA